MKILGMFVLILVSLYYVNNSEMLSELMNKSEKNKRESSSGLDDLLTIKPKKLNKNLKIKGGKIFWEGWVRYFKYTGGKITRPSNFFKNPEFFKQKVTKRDLKKKDEKGNYFIAEQFEFYAKLTKDQLNLFYKRMPLPSGDMLQSVDILHIENIIPITKENRSQGSIYDLGTFAEGSCFQVYTNKPNLPDLNFDFEKDNGAAENWIICLDKKKEKENLISTLILLKENQQKDKEENDSKQTKKPTTLDNLMQKTKQFEKRNDGNPKDGYWVLLQDWTGCSLKCGGGKSYQHWMCVPPKTGGRPCDGKAIREKPCNIQLCPGTKVFSYSGASKQSPLDAIEKPIIKSLPISSRPQNFVKCEIKESDILYINTKVNQKDRIPARIVMNNRSVSLFTDESFKSNIFSFNLKDTEIAKFSKDSCCFNLESGTQQFTICGGFGQLCGGGLESYSFVSEWFKDFNMFKFNCFEELKDHNWKIAQAKKAKEDAENEAGLANIEDRANMIKKKLHEKELDIMQKKMDKTEKIALQALKREFDVEKMLTMEVRQKALLEAKVLLEQKKHEEKKKEALESLFKEREKEEERKRDNKLAQLEIEKIKEEIKKQVLMKRLALRNKIQEILKKSDRRKRSIENEIRVIRSKIARNLAEANKKGEIEKCESGMRSAETRKDYCKQNINENFSKYNECINENSFCYLCCENEFGNMVMDKRDQCYTMCDHELANLLGYGNFEWKK